jgi:hypothetical protein
LIKSWAARRLGFKNEGKPIVLREQVEGVVVALLETSFGLEEHENLLDPLDASGTSVSVRRRRLFPDSKVQLGLFLREALYAGQWPGLDVQVVDCPRIRARRHLVQRQDLPGLDALVAAQGITSR